MAKNVSDFLLERLEGWGVQTIYGYPGDGINGIIGALGRREGEPPRFIQARHEELAAFMACAHAKFTGEVGVCLATSGPGAIHLLNGLYDAAKDHQPVLAIVGQAKTTSLGSDYQQEVDLISLFKDVAHRYVQMCVHPAQLRQLVDRALRIAQAERAVTCIILPSDLQELDHEDPPREHGSVFTGIGYRPPRIVPHPDQLQQAADALNAGERVAMLVGAGALDATHEVKEAANLLQAGVAKALLGKAVLPDALPWVTGCIGLLGTRPSDVLMRDCDTLLLVGTTFPYSEWLPPEGQARGVQIDIQARNLSVRYPMEVNLCGDAAETLQALMPLLETKQDRSWRDRIEAEVAEWWALLEDRAHNPADPINPQLVFWELSPRLPDGSILIADSGSSANWWARDLKVREGMMASLSGNLATMACGVPYALAAKVAHPDRPVVACIGDGAMQMLGINGLITISQHWLEWENKQLILLVLYNEDLNQVTWEQRAMAGDPKFEASQVLPRFGYAQYAESLGLKGIEMRTPEDVASGWEAALAADRPVLVEAWTDPEVPPLPPHIDFDQAKAYVQAVFQGDPNAWRMIVQSARDLASKVKK